jgi:hypothetical protein
MKTFSLIVIFGLLFFYITILFFYCLNLICKKDEKVQIQSRKKDSVV